MKMQRSHCENENVQLVQELAEVDGPFESPININFRDLIKLELPNLTWNRNDVCPKKMKITNTGHTVIISGKWKCERPYLTGGPLSGKYVFSQIHFHWGPDECEGSEHRVCGEGFPLEMHVTHFKTEYLSQECALREKDGMVVVVYLFKLQDEPNPNFKKILNLLPCIKQPSTSYPIDPRPIVSLCSPFKEDYFMYWGSVVTSTCAHILLWIICREPLGISKEQVQEFRKLLDLQQQPICRNSRDTQPLHKRNVFHVNASNCLDEPLLPVKKLTACCCKKSEDNCDVKPEADCCCQPFYHKLEDVEGDIADYRNEHDCSPSTGKQTVRWETSVVGDCYPQQSIIVQSAAIHPLPVALKRFDSEPVGNSCDFHDLQLFESRDHLRLSPVSKSCCFFPTKEVRKTKTREKKKPFNTIKAFSHLMDSLEALKNQTFKKLKEIESINREIKEMRPFCQDHEDKQWLRKVERLMTKQKRFTVKTSNGCFNEIKKLAKECNFDKFFDGKMLPVGDNNQKMLWLNETEIPNEAFTYSYTYMKGENVSDILPSYPVNVSKAAKFSAKAQKLIQSFFEDIKENDEIQETVKRDLSLRKLESMCNKQAGDSPMRSNYITKKMFKLGNLGDRFFREVSTDDFEISKNQWPDKKIADEIIYAKQENQIKKIIDNLESINKTPSSEAVVPEKKNGRILSVKNNEIIPLHRANIVIEVSKRAETAGLLEDMTTQTSYRSVNPKKLSFDKRSQTDSLSSEDELHSHPRKRSQRKSIKKIKKELYDLTGDKLLKELESKVRQSHAKPSSSNFSEESNETQRMIIAKIHKRPSRNNIWEKESSLFSVGDSLKEYQEKTTYKKPKLKNYNFEGYYIQKKNLKNNKRKSQKNERVNEKNSCVFDETSKEKFTILKSKQLTKTKFRLEIENTSDTTATSSVENSLVSPVNKKFKMEPKKEPPHAVQILEKNSRLHVANTETKTVYPPQSNNKNNDVLQTKIKIFIENESAPLEANTVDNQPNTITNIKKTSITRCSTNESLLDSNTVSTSKTFSKTSSSNSTGSAEKKESKKPEEYEPPIPMKKETVKKEISRPLSSKIVAKAKSLVSVTPKHHVAEKPQRFFIESIDDRMQNLIESSDLNKKEEEEIKITNIKEIHGHGSCETYKKSSEEKQEVKELRWSSENQEKTEAEGPKNVEFSVGFVTAPSYQINETFFPKSIIQKEKDKNTIKRCDAEKYNFLENRIQKITEGKPEHPPEPTCSEKSLVKDSPPFTPHTNEPLLSLSYSTPQKNSRHHSAETLTSIPKPIKRKSKKRPCCRTRSSRPFIRKTFSAFRKPNKAENKVLPLLGLTNEEQLKIISVNVANYLKEKLAGQNPKENTPEECPKIDDAKEVPENNLELPKENSKEKLSTKVSSVKNVAIKKDKKVMEKTEVEKKSQVEKSPDNKKEEEPPKPPETKQKKPVHNFIKLNKQMAGKYKRTPPQDDFKKDAVKEEEKRGLKFSKSKTKTLKRKKEKYPIEKQDIKPSRISTPRSPKRLQTPEKSKIPQTPKTKTDPKIEKTRNKSDFRESKQTSQSHQLEKIQKDTHFSSLVLPKKTQARKRLVPAYMLNSYLPLPLEIVESQKNKMNKYLLSMNNEMENYLPEILIDGLNKPMSGDKNDNAIKNELEYLIKLQMCVNNEISTNIEKSLGYVKAFFNPDCPQPENNNVVMLQMKDFPAGSSSTSDINDDLHKLCRKKNPRDSKSLINLKGKEIITLKTPKESGDSGVVSVSRFHELPEELNSDSSYDCKISITLNPKVNYGDGETQSTETNNCLDDISVNSQATVNLPRGRGSSQSLVLRQHRKKRKENEISFEMKQKLLEILEGEIKREIGITGEGSSENSSEGLVARWEDSDGNTKSQTTESSCDMEVLTQISETMRQYLSDFKERRRFEDITNEFSDKDSKDYDSA